MAMKVTTIILNSVLSVSPYSNIQVINKKIPDSLSFHKQMNQVYKHHQASSNLENFERTRPSFACLIVLWSSYIVASLPLPTNPIFPSCQINNQDFRHCLFDPGVSSRGCHSTTGVLVTTKAFQNGLLLELDKWWHIHRRIWSNLMFNYIILGWSAKTHLHFNNIF